MFQNGESGNFYVVYILLQLKKKRISTLESKIWFSSSCFDTPASQVTYWNLSLFTCKMGITILPAS